MKLGHRVSEGNRSQHPVKFFQAHFWGLLQRSFGRAPTTDNASPQSGKDTETTKSKSGTNPGGRAGETDLAVGARDE